MLNEPLLAFLKAILVLYSYTKDKYVLLKSLLAVNTLTLRLMIKVSDDVTEKENKKNKTNSTVLVKAHAFIFQVISLFYSTADYRCAKLWCLILCHP